MPVIGRISHEPCSDELQAVHGLTGVAADKMIAAYSSAVQRGGRKEGGGARCDDATTFSLVFSPR